MSTVLYLLLESNNNTHNHRHILYRCTCMCQMQACAHSFILSINQGICITNEIASTHNWKSLILCPHAMYMELINNIMFNEIAAKYQPGMCRSVSAIAKSLILLSTICNYLASFSFKLISPCTWNTQLPSNMSKILKLVNFESMEYLSIISHILMLR